MTIYKTFTFDSAHFLPNVPDGHKCKAMHGHTYQLTGFLEGELEPKLDWVVDFAELKNVVKPILDTVDHKLINALAGLENTTCENFAIWFWNKIIVKMPMLTKIELKENATSGAIYEGK